MAGLLDGMLDSDSLRLGLGLLAAGGPTTDPNRTGIGQRLQEGLGSFDAYKQNALKQKMLEAQMQEQMQAQQQAKALRELSAKFAMPGKPALAPLMGDAESGILPSAGREAVAPSYDYAGFANAVAGIDPMKAMTINAALKKESPKFSTAPQYDQQGNAFILAENGEMKYLSGVKARDKLEEVRLGDKVAFRSPYSTEMQGSMPIGQDANSKASNAVAWANNAATLRGQNMTDARARDRLSFEQGGGIESGGATQIGFNKQFGKPQAGYRWKPDGSMEFIPGGPADQKAQAQKGGEGTVGGVVADLRDKYTKLDADNGIVSTNNRIGTNLGAAFGSSGVGQFLNGAVGTKTQSSRDSIAMTRPLLLQAIMKATGMSAKQMDSNAELKLYLATATDPQKGLEANLEALDRIESLYGGGNERFKANTPQASTKNGWSMQKVN